MAMVVLMAKAAAAIPLSIYICFKFSTLCAYFKLFAY